MRRVAVLASVALLVTACTSSGGSDPTVTVTPSTPAVSTPTTPPVSTPVTTPITTPVTTATTPSVPTDVPTTGPNAKPGEKPPVMPAAARQHTPAGAAAFAKFFMQTVDWGRATLSPAYLRHYSKPTCETCTSYIRGLDAARSAGHRYIGGRETIKSTRSGAGGPLRQQIVTVDSTAFEELDADGKFVSGDPAYRNQRWVVKIEWTSTGWLVAELTVRL